MLFMDTMDLNSSSPFFRLPREIRDLIYEHVLVQNTIAIECAITKVSTVRVTGRRPASSATEINHPYPLHLPWIHRRVWNMPAFDVDLDYRDSDPDVPYAVLMTYQLASDPKYGANMKSGLHLLKVCRQIYAEASKVFYNKNIFSFTGDFRVPAAFAFLCDRPAASLLQIWSLELALMEDNNMRGTTHAHYPAMLRSTDSLVLQYAYQYFPELCTLLSTSRMALRRLYLTMETSSLYTGGSPLSIKDSLGWERTKLVQRSNTEDNWFEPLFKIQGLESIDLYWIFCPPRLQRMSDAVAQMRQHMLRGAPGDEMLRGTGSTPAFQFKMQYHGDTDSIPAEDEKSFAEWTTWRDCELYQDRLSITLGNDSRTQSRSLALRDHHVDILTGYSRAYICHCHLNGR